MEPRPDPDGVSDAMPEATIAKALERVQAQIARVERERSELERLILLAREEERLLLRLLALRRNGLPDDRQVASQASSQGEPVGTDPATAGHSGAGSAHPALQAVVSELAATLRPLHISDLMRRLRERGVTIPGAGTQANLISHLRRDPRLVRPSRGMYGLSAWGLENMPPAARHKRHRKRVRSSATKGGANG